jgi:methyltransferase (TIGR00027 family)
MTSPITHVSDTARWVALYRAMESERRDPLFRDPYARRLAGEQGEAILRGMKQGRRWAWPMIVRTAVMDEIILRAITRDGVDTVLNLAAGLDARPYRLPLPPTLRWVDVDLPDILTYKEQQLAGETPSCAVEFAKMDLRDAAARRALFAGVAASARRVLVVTEGLLIYLTPEQVADLAKDLAAQRAFRWWLIDIASPLLLQWMQRTWGKTATAGNAAFIFAPAEDTKFFAPYGWREVEYRNTMDEGIRLKRVPKMMFFWRILGLFASRARKEQFKRFSGIVLLERREGA